MKWCRVKRWGPPSEPRQETTKSLVRKRSHSWVHLNKWVCIIPFGIFSGKPLIAMCFSQIYTACLRDHIPTTLKDWGWSSDQTQAVSGRALLINNTQRGGVELCAEACRRVTRGILKLLSSSNESGMFVLVPERGQSFMGTQLPRYYRRLKQEVFTH